MEWGQATGQDFEHMRLSALFIRLIVFAIAAALSVAAARATVAVVEDRSVIAVQETLVDQGYEWASVLGDGLQVILEGEAPTEAVRFRAISAAGGVVDASRVIDNLSVIDSAAIAPPEFAVEILRNDAGISLIGLVPTTTDREALANRLADIADGLPITDFTESADYPAPATWRDALNYGLRALNTLDAAKISINAERVTVTALAESPEEKRRLETALARNTPDGVRLAVEISAPRPVISPFTTRFTLDEDGARFDACTADTSEAVSQIIAAASEAGFQQRANCVLALGAPSRTWGEAVALAIGAVKSLGGGTVTIADTDVTLTAPIGTGQATFDNIAGRLENALPDAFALTAILPEAPQSSQDTPQFVATLSPEGMVQIRGSVPDAVANTLAENFALAKFGQASITMGTREREGLPAGWSVRMLAGIEALSALSNGSVVMEPGSMQVRGNTGDADASATITALLLEKLGPNADFTVDVTYVEQLDPVAGLPTPEECIAQIRTVTDGRKILFDPGSADLTAETQPVVDDIADILKVCGDLPVRIAGYTDSQGREEMNQQLSQARANAVLMALSARRVPISTFEAVGFGEDNPIADNSTEEGREANRRIEFSLIVPESTAQESSTLDAVAEETPLEGATENAPEEAAPADDAPAEEESAEEPPNE